MNPFLASAKIRLLKKKSIIRNTTNTNESVSQLYSETTMTSLIEVDTFTKNYKYSRQLGLIKDLSPLGCRLYIYILYKLKKDQDYINLKRSRVSKDLGISTSGIGLAIGSLVDSGLLCKKSQSEYWINPIIMFNGNRKAYFIKQAPDMITYLEDHNPVVKTFTDDIDHDKIIMT